MELLEKSEELLLALKTKYEDLVKLEEEIHQFKDYNETLESLFQKEFSLLLDMTSIYDDLLRCLDELEKVEGMRFIVRRIRQDSEQYVLVEVLYAPEEGE